MTSTADYFEHAREDVFHLLPDTCLRVLELGVGMGNTIAALGKVRTVAFAAGLEKERRMGALAESVLDEVLIGDAEKIDLPDHWSCFDLILCLDVLEHLVDPWQMVHRLHDRLAERGTILISVPNVSYYKASLPLFFSGAWKLTDAGVLDRTHLRFFVKSTTADLITCSGLRLVALEAGGIPKFSKRWWANTMTAGLLERMLAPQIYASASRSKLSVQRQVNISLNFRTAPTS